MSVINEMSNIKFSDLKLKSKSKPYYYNQDQYLIGVTEDNLWLYMEDFKWDCGWYWGGCFVWGYKNNNQYSNAGYNFHYLMYNNENDYDKIVKTPLSEKEMWRLLDLMKQFKALKNCAEVFQYGGHMTSDGRTKAELNKSMADKLNKHIEMVIIPEFRKLLKNVKAI